MAHSIRMQAIGKYIAIILLMPSKTKMLVEFKKRRTRKRNINKQSKRPSSSSILGGRIKS